MTTETIEAPQDAPATVDATAEWNAGLDEIREKDSPSPQPKTEQTEPAPSNEGVVVSESAKTTEPETKTEAKPPEQKRLGGLSTDELLQRVKESPNDPDTLRALEIRLKRLDSQATPRRERNKSAQTAAVAANEVQAALKGLNDDFPEIASRLAPVGKFAEAIARPMIEAEEREQVQADETVVESAFPGFNKLRAPGGPLDSWLKSQPYSVREQATQGGVAGAMLVLEQYEQHVIAEGKPSPFAPPVPVPPAPAAPPAFDVNQKAAQIKADREKRLQAASAVPSGARLPAQTQETSARAAWLAGVEEAKRTRRNE